MEMREETNEVIIILLKDLIKEIQKLREETRQQTRAILSGQI